MTPLNRSPRTDAPTFVLHWALVLALFFSLSTGLRIAADVDGPSWARALDPLLLQGEVIRWHTWAAYSLALIALAYVFFLLRVRLTARVALDGARLRSLRASDRRARWTAVNVVIYWTAFTLLGLATVTGVLLYLAPGLLPHATVAALHQAVAWLTLAYVLLHIVAQLVMGGLDQLFKILRPRAAYGSAAVLALVLAGAVAGVLYYSLEASTVRDLQVARTANPPRIDGDSSDSAWAKASGLEIHTVRGMNQPGEGVPVYVRALHDGEQLYALFEWRDPTRSQKHLPLIKTEQGWKVLQREYGIQDEDEYYEDKFGVMLSYSPRLAAGAIHLGPEPLAGRPGATGGRGLHYTTDGSVVDVWHWKSVRSGSPAMNQIDDNYFGPPLEPKPGKRYTGGYTQDPKTAGGFRMNWERFDDGMIRPVRLPKDPAFLQALQRLDLDPHAGDEGELWLLVEDTVPYAEALDYYAVGTVMPSVLIEGLFEGDRGDVQAFAKWSDGWWRMEVSRRLDTGSEYDVALHPGTPVYLWVAAFDHAQTRHSQHLHPVRVILE